MEIIEINEQQKNYDVQGISGTVTKNATRGYEYPCIRILLNREKPPAQCDVLLLKNMMIRAKKEIDNITRTITVYIGTEENIKKVGKIYPIQLASILDTFEDQTIEGYMSAGKKLEGNYVYAMGE